MKQSFDRWLDELIRGLSLSNAKISAHGGIDRSLISRFRSGARVPADDHIQLHKLLNGILGLVQERGQEQALDAYTERRPDEDSEAALYRAALDCLGGGSALPLSFAKGLSLRHFSDRLALMMDGLDITNARLARVLNIDSSLVSRWRSGMRLIKADNPLLLIICQYFAKQLIQQERQVEEGEADPAFMEQMKKELSVKSFRDQSRLEGSLFDWLLCEQDTLDRTRFVVEEFIRYVMENSGALPVPASREELLAQLNQNQMLCQILESASSRRSKSRYRGITGMREAVLRFLLEVTMSETPCLLKLFSTQGMDWLVTDPDFMRIWGFLMQLLLKQGHRIEIIHHFGRAKGEILDAIRYWLPVYMSGGIEPYTCDSFNQPAFASAPLVKTLFINSGKTAISGEFFQGTEEQAVFRYLNQPESVEALEQQFDYLKSRSERIVSVQKGEKQVEARLDAHLDARIVPVPEGEKPELVELCSALPLYLTPDNLLDRAMADNGFTEAEQAFVRRRHRQLCKHHADFLQSGGTYHLIAPMPPAAEENAAREISLFGLNLPTLKLKPELYRELMASLRRRTLECPVFRLHPVAIAPFDRLNMIALNKELVMLMVRGDTPHLLEIRHSLVSSFFRVYITAFLHQSAEDDSQTD